MKTHKIDHLETEVEIPIVRESSDPSSEKNREKETCDNCEFSCETEEELKYHRDATHHPIC